MKLVALISIAGLVASGTVTPYFINLEVREDDHSEWMNLTVPYGLECTNFDAPMTEARLDPDSLGGRDDWYCDFWADPGCKKLVKIVGESDPQKTFKPAISVRCPQNPF